MIGSALRPETGAMAGALDYGVGYSVAHHTNLTHDTENPTPEVVHGAIVGAAYREDSPAFSAQAMGQLENRQYRNQNYVDDTVPYLRGALSWYMLPRTLTWSADAVLTELRRDFRAGDVPDNRVQVAAFGTGPELALWLGESDSVHVGARYGSLRSQSDNDNWRVITYGRLQHRTSNLTTLSVHADAARVTFTETDLAPFDWVNAYGTFEFGRFEIDPIRPRPSPNGFLVQLGNSRVRQDDSQLTGRLTRAVYSRQLTPESELRFSAANQISDTYSDMLRGLTSQGSVGDPVILPGVPGTDVTAVNPYYSKLRELLLFNESADARVGGAVRAYTRHIDYVTQELDNRETGGRLDVRFLASADLRLNFYAAYTRRDFDNLERTDRDRYLAVGGTHLLSRRLSLTFEVWQMTSDSSVLGSFSDRRVRVLLGYSSGPLYTVESRR